MNAKITCVVALAVTALFGLASQASANTPLTPIPGDQSNFVAASTPQFYFTRANNHDACWPVPAFDATGARTRPPRLTPWPDSDTGCPGRWFSYPTYTGMRTCFGTEVRVAFTLYLGVQRGT
jgi:hypothetical protein